MGRFTMTHVCSVALLVLGLLAPGAAVVHTMTVRTADSPAPIPPPAACDTFKEKKACRAKRCTWSDNACTPAVVAEDATATDVAPPAAYACTTGSLNGAGSFLHVANLSVAAAKQWCIASAPCFGFTARMGAGNKTTPWAAACTTKGLERHQFYFKGGVSGTNADPSWRIWQKRNYAAPHFYCSGGNASTSTSTSTSGGSGDSGGGIVRGASSADLQAHASRSKCTLCPPTDPTCRRVTYVDKDCLGLC